MTANPVDWVWRRLNWPRPPDPEYAVELATRLAADPLAPPLVFELRAEHTGLRYLLGVPPEHVRRMVGDRAPPSARAPSGGSSAGRSRVTGFLDQCVSEGVIAADGAHYLSLALPVGRPN